MKEHYLQKINCNLKAALDVLGQCRRDSKKIVFTNGCFDLIHSGHLQYLYEAKQLGDFLVIGVNDDDSVQRLKGVRRPILKLTERMELLSGLEMIDMLIPFSEDTPMKLIETIKPDVLVKGGDYEFSTIVGAELVMQQGGQVKVLSFKDGVSTTDIIDKILKNYND